MIIENIANFSKKKNYYDYYQLHIHQLYCFFFFVERTQNWQKHISMLVSNTLEFTTTL